MFPSVASRLLFLSCLSACAPAAQETAQLSQPPAAPGAASQGCSRPATSATATSKLRHIPDEEAPCPDSRGLAPPQK